MKLTLTPNEIKQLLTIGHHVLLIDVRSEKEYLEKHVPQAIHVPLESIKAGTFTPQNFTLVVTICEKGGGRSETAANLLRNLFKADVYFLDGGTVAWFS